MIRKLSSNQIFRQMYGFKWYKLKINDYMGSSLTLCEDKNVNIT